MAEAALNGDILLAMTLHATSHFGEIGHLGHDIRLCDIAVACLALDVRLQVRPVLPEHKIRECIDPHPGNGLPRGGEIPKLVDCRRILGDSNVAGHAFRNCWEGHLNTWFRIGVAVLAFQSERDMFFVIERNGLRVWLSSELRQRGAGKSAGAARIECVRHELRPCRRHAMCAYRQRVSDGRS